MAVPAPELTADLTGELSEAVCQARGHRSPLEIVGGGSKRFYGRTPSGQPLSTAGHRGIVSYEPSELVITARTGTPLAQIEQALAEHGQRLAFEPPHLGPGATLGGTVACGLSGPRRPYAGAVRDALLGVKVITGRGEVLAFGGQVVKNVAGFDLFRPMAGALGTLGVLLEASLRVLPVPAAETTLSFEIPVAEAIRRVNAWAGRPLPLSAACHDGERLWLRLSGTESGVRAAHERLGGDPAPDGEGFWEALREQRLPFFAGEAPLWRLALPPTASPLELPGRWLTDWGGAQRWLRTEVPAEAIRAAAAAAGGHATLFRGGERSGEVFQPLAPPLFAVHQRLKSALDPDGILNPGRLFQGL